MWFENKGTYIIAHKDENDARVHCEELLEAMANSINITFDEILNEGFPIALGNTFFVFDFTAYADGYKFQYVISANETAELNENGFCIITPYPFVDLEN